MRSVLDMAEIPTFQESQTIDTDQDGSLSQDEINIYAGKITPTYLSNLLLVVDGQPIELREIAKSISLPLGSGNLPTLRIEWDLLGDLPIENLSAVHRLNFENKNYSERVGWNEIVVGRVGGINIFNSSAFGSGITNELKAYPNETLNAPLSEKKAEFSLLRARFPTAQKFCKTATDTSARPSKKTSLPN
ncbi:MAG: hypothetical protein WKF71_17255 [Pyrinomonadaceae bacterium]